MEEERGTEGGEQGKGEEGRGREGKEERRRWKDTIARLSSFLR